MSADKRARLKQWLESGEARLHPLTFPQRELWEASPVPVAMDETDDEEINEISPE